MMIGACIFAEGGCLVDAGDSGNDKGDRYAEMAAMASMWHVPVYPFSIGGNGRPVGTPKGGLGGLWRDGGLLRRRGPGLDAGRGHGPS